MQIVIMHEHATTKNNKGQQDLHHRPLWPSFRKPICMTELLEADLYGQALRG